MHPTTANVPGDPEQRLGEFGMTREQQIAAAEGRRSPVTYEAPHLAVLGTFHELTKKVTGKTDGGGTMS
jgi:hypothetical protein